MNYLDIIAPAITIIAVACYISQIITRLQSKLTTVTAQRDRLAKEIDKLESHIATVKQCHDWTTADRDAVARQRDRLAEALRDLVESCNCIDSVDFMPASMPEAFEKALQSLTPKP
jgi:phage shock protein A